MTEAQIRYIPTSENPWNIATRRSITAELQNSRLWWESFKWIKEEKKEWLKWEFINPKEEVIEWKEIMQHDEQKK